MFRANVPCPTLQIWRGAQRRREAVAVTWIVGICDVLAVVQIVYECSLSQRVRFVPLGRKRLLIIVSVAAILAKRVRILSLRVISVPGRVSTWEGSEGFVFLLTTLRGVRPKRATLRSRLIIAATIIAIILLATILIRRYRVFPPRAVPRRRTKALVKRF